MWRKYASNCKLLVWAIRFTSFWSYLDVIHVHQICLLVNAVNKVVSIIYIIHGASYTESSIHTSIPGQFSFASQKGIGFAWLFSHIWGGAGRGVAFMLLTHRPTQATGWPTRRQLLFLFLKSLMYKLEKNVCEDRFFPPPVSPTAPGWRALMRAWLDLGVTQPWRDSKLSRSPMSRILLYDQWRP